MSPKTAPSITPSPDSTSIAAAQPDTAAELDAGDQQADDEQSSEEEDGHGAKYIQLREVGPASHLCKQGNSLIEPQSVGNSKAGQRMTSAPSGEFRNSLVPSPLPSLTCDLPASSLCVIHAR